MNALADRYQAHNVGSVFVYTHEAHPGEYYPHLTSMEQKFRHARDLRDVLGVTRPILLDALDGACHRAYGSMPNMTWIFTGSGIPIWRNFAQCLRRDLAAVHAGLETNWSNGPTEGHVNRLKCLKRQMYGRAKLDLLRQRLLAA